VTNPEQASDRGLRGKCLCGGVHYVVADEFIYAANCHCSNCRRATGSAFKPFAGIERHKLGITKGEDNLLIFGGENGNSHRRSGHPSGHAHLRRLQGPVVHNHRRPAPIRRACDDHWTGGRIVMGRIFGPDPFSGPVFGCT